MTDDSEDTLAARVLEYEHRIYPEAVRLIASHSTRVRGHQVFIPSANWSADGLINPAIDYESD